MTNNIENEVDKVFDCFDECCGECSVCKYLNFVEWTECVGKPEGSVIQRNELIEDYLDRKERYEKEISTSLTEQHQREKEAIVRKLLEKAWTQVTGQDSKELWVNVKDIKKIATNHNIHYE